MSIDSIRSDFELLDDWEDRYRYVIELGRGLTPLADGQKTDANKVRGCASQVWLVSSLSRDEVANRPKMHFAGDSDAHIVRGLIAILFAIYENKTPEDVLASDAQAVFDDLGLREHLTPQRSNGFASMIQRMRADAAAALAAPLTR